MVLFYNDMFIFSVKVLYSKGCISEIKFINCFECDFYLMDFLKTIIFEHKIVAFSDLFFIFFDFLVHLNVKTLFNSLTKLLAESVFNINENDEEKYSITFEFNVSLLELLDLKLR